MAASSSNVPALVRQLQQARGQAEQLAAVRALDSLMDESPELSPALLTAGAIPDLVGCLQQGNSPNLLITAATALGKLTIASPTTREAVAAAGGIPALVRCLEIDNPPVQQYAAACLVCVCEDNYEHEYTSALVAAGSIPLLVRCLPHSGDLKPAVLTLLSILADYSDESCAAIQSAGGIHVLVGCLDAASPDAVFGAAAEALGHLASGSSDLQAAIAAAGGLTALVQYLRSSSSRGSSNSSDIDVTGEAQQATMTALRSLIGENPENQAAMAAAGGIPVVLRRLQHSGRAVEKTEAAKLLRDITWAATSLYSTALVEAGGIPVLMHNLSEGDSNSNSVMGAAAKALANIAFHISDCIAVIAAAGGIPMLVHHLSNNGSEAVQAAAAAALSALATGNHGEGAAIMAAGGIPILAQRLVTGSEDVQEEAAGALLALTREGPAAETAIVAAGIFPALVQVLGSTTTGEAVQAAAALLMLQLSFYSYGGGDSACRALVAANGVAALLQCARHSCSQEARECAVTALWELSSTENCTLIDEAGAIPVLVHCLDLGSAKRIQEDAVCPLLVLAKRIPDCRARIAAAGGIAALQQLHSSSPSKDARNLAAEALQVINDGH